MLDLFHQLPVSMQVRQQWLVWKFINKGAGKKPAKVPFYASGQPRGWPNGKPKDGIATEAQPNVDQGHELDRAALVSFEAALEALRINGGMSGLGFAFLPGDGLIGVDIDGAIDPETGEVSDLCRTVVNLCDSYTEYSVSGHGVHIILAGETPKFKDDLIGLEVYCSSQFFTCTGRPWLGAPKEVQFCQPHALATMKQMVENSLEAQRVEREAGKLAKALEDAAAAGQVKPKRAPMPQGGAQPGGDFQRVNAMALERLDAWVPSIFPDAKLHTSPKGRGYRVTSKALGRDLEEDIAITPGGIQDFGTREGKSAIDLAVEFRGMTPREAMLWLASLVGVEVSKPMPRRDQHRQAEPPDADDGPAGSDVRPEPPPPPLDEKPAAPRKRGEGDEAEPETGQGKGKKRAPMSEFVKDNLDALRANFAYQYGSEIAWDIPRRKPIKISHLRHSYGGDAVKIWMASPTRRVVQDEQVAFEPGVDLGPDCINLYAGLAVEPVEGDCSVMVELLTHLCSTSEVTVTDADGNVTKSLGAPEIVTWVLRWCALPLQQIGAKLDTALVFHGPMGTGKNLFFDVIRDLYGEYGVMVGQTEIEDKYNTWLSRRMFIVGDEVVSRQEMYHAKNRLKWIITQRTKIPIRAMHMDTRWESNHANLAFLSNESQPLALEDGDRRMCVIYTPTAERTDLYARVSAFIDGGGAAKFLHYLQNLDLGDFNAHTKPPLTNAKRNLIELGYKPAERFMHEWIKGYLALPMRVCSSEQLYGCFRRWAEASGERFPPKQAEFTEQAKRICNERVELDADGRVKDPVMVHKVFQLPKSMEEGGGRKAVRCWVPRGCENKENRTDGSPMTEGEWAAGCVRDFEETARKFLRRERYGSDDGGGDGT